MSERAKIPYEPSEEKLYDVAPDAHSRERIRALRDAYRAIDAMFPGMVGLTAFGSLTKGKDISGADAAQQTDIDFLPYVNASEAKLVPYRTLYEHPELRIAFIRATIASVRHAYGRSAYGGVRSMLEFSSHWPNVAPLLDVGFLNAMDPALPKLHGTDFDMRRSRSAEHLNTFAKPLRESLERAVSGALEALAPRAMDAECSYDAYVELLERTVEDVEQRCAAVIGAIADEVRARTSSEGTLADRESQQWGERQLEDVRGAFRVVRAPVFDRVVFACGEISDRVKCELRAHGDRAQWVERASDLAWHYTTPLPGRGTYWAVMEGEGSASRVDRDVRLSAFFGLDVGGGMRKFRRWFFDGLQEQPPEWQQRSWDEIVECVFRARYRGARDPEAARAVFREQFPQTVEDARRKFLGER